MAVPIYNEYYHEFGAAYGRTSTKGIANSRYILSHMMNDYGWQYGAVCGLLGNIQAESAISPNRPQSSSEDAFPYVSTSDSRVGGNYGFGLVQWTPWYQAYNSNWVGGGGTLTPENGDNLGHPTYYYWCLNVYKTGEVNRTDNNPIGLMEPQLRYINDVPWGYYKYNRWQSSGYYYNYNWEEYKQITAPEEAAGAWLFNYERPGSISGSSATIDTVNRVYNTRASNARWFYDAYYDEFGTGTPQPPQKEKHRNFLILAYGAGLFGRK